ncbi:MAG: FAD-dependent oxidoreductase [Planctomycetota bacterium]
MSGKEHSDIVAAADHALNTHSFTSERVGCGELDEPYGVPYRCLLPRSINNLLVACRGGDSVPWQHRAVT